MVSTTKNTVFSTYPWSLRPANSLASAQWNQEHNLMLEAQLDMANGWQPWPKNPWWIHDDYGILWIQDVATRSGKWLLPGKAFFRGKSNDTNLCSRPKPTRNCGLQQRSGATNHRKPMTKNIVFLGVWMGTAIPQIGILNDSHIINIYIYLEIWCGWWF